MENQPFEEEQQFQQAEAMPPTSQAETPATFRAHLPLYMQRAFDHLPEPLQRMAIFQQVTTNPEMMAVQYEAIVMMSTTYGPGLGQSPGATGPKSGPHPAEIAGRLKDLGQPAKYQGNQKSNAANHWLYDVDDYFMRRQMVSGRSDDDAYKLAFAAGLLTGDAQVKWRTTNQQVDAGLGERITTWADFKAWIRTKFEPKTAESDRLREYTHKQQGNDSLSTYHAALLELSRNLSESPSERGYILQLVSGLNSTLRAEWFRQQGRPEANAEEAVNLLLELERSTQEASGYGRPIRHIKAGRAPASPDAMDLSAMQDTRTCFKCGKPGHLKRNCKVKGKGQGQQA